MSVIIFTSHIKVPFSVDKCDHLSWLSFGIQFSQLWFIVFICMV